MQNFYKKTRNYENYKQRRKGLISIEIHLLLIEIFWLFVLFLYGLFLSQTKFDNTRFSDKRRKNEN